MKTQIASIAVGGKGSVKIPYASNDGVCVKRGLRNKRKAYWSKIRQNEIREKENKRRAEEAAEREREMPFDFFDENFA